MTSFDEAAATVAQRIMKQTGTPQQTATDPFDEAARAVVAERARSAVAASVSVNPDADARLQDLGKRYNVPISALRLNPTPVERKAEIDAVNYGTLAVDSPATVGFLTNPNNAAIARDDTENLATIDRTFSSAFKKGLIDPIKNIGQTLEVLGMEETGASLQSIKEPNGYQSASDAFINPTEDMFSIGGFAPQYLPRATVEQLGQVLGSISTRAVGAAGGGAIGSLVGPEGTVVGAALGAYSGPFVFEAAQIVGPIAKDRARRSGYEKPTKEDLAVAWLTAASSGALNAVGAKYLPGGEQATGTFTKRLVNAVFGEGATEAAQSVVEQTGSTAGTTLGFEVSPKQAIGEGVLGATAGSTAVAGEEAITKGIDRLAGRKQQAAEAVKDAEALTKIDAVVAASKLRERSPQKFEEFVAQATEDGPVQNIYIDPKALAQSGVNPEELAKVSRSVAEQVNTAITTGVDIRIPIAEYSTYIAGTDAGKALLDYIKTDPEGMSRKEAEEFYQKEGDALKAEVEKVLTAKQNDEAWQQSLAQVKEDFMGKLQAANRFTPDVNEAYLAPYLAGVQVRAAKMGITPMEFYKQYGLGVQAESVAGPALDQVTREQALETNVKMEMPTDVNFASAVEGTPGAKLTNEGLVIDLVRYQKSEQEGGQAVRTGVFYLPTGSKQERYYKNQDTTKGGNAYGGTERMQGETLIRRPLFVKGSTGGNAPKAAYDMLIGKSAYEKMASDVRQTIGGDHMLSRDLKIENIKNVLERYDANPDLAYEILAASTKGNTKAYAIIENIVAHAIRKAGYDAMVGYSKGRGENVKTFISEVFDVREQTYPTTAFDSQIHEDFYQSNDPNAAADFLRSVLLDAARNLKQAKGSGEQMLGILKNTAGVKEEEIAWTGLDDFLKGKESVTKDEIVKYLTDNQVQIEEVTLGGNVNEELPAGYSVERSGGSSWMVVDGEGQSVGPSLGTRDAAIRGYLDQEGLQTSATKFSQYTLPGGENYREVLLTLPQRVGKEDARLQAARELNKKMIDKYGSLSEAFDKMTTDEKSEFDRVHAEASIAPPTKADETYKSSHYDQPNILAHFRLNDRTDADGKKVLFIEEIQSDWHQAGRKKGYGTRDVENTFPRIEYREDSGGYVPVGDNGLVLSTLAFPTLEEAQAHQIKMAERLNRPPTRKEGVPDAPFKKTWHEMAFRRITQMAAQQGYDRIAWTTGEQQAERYDLSKQYDSIDYDKFKGEDTIEVRAYAKGSSSPDLVKRVSSKELPDVVGKEIADKIINGEESGSLSGLDLKVGGEGMKGFYDNILVKYAQKFGKKFGAKVGETDISEDARPIKDQQVLDLAWELGSPETSTAGMSARVHSLDITPEMVDAANKGFELFQGKRGAYSPKQRMTTLLNAADLTTFLHELGHYFLDIDTQIAMRADAPAEIKADVDTVLKWFGFDGDTPEARLQRWMVMPLDEQRPYHEQFAESFEHYLFEGKAPSIELQNVFKRFRAWMLATYKSLQDFLSRNPAAGKLNDEIRGVMNRMLATTEQIKEAEITRSMQPLFVTPEDAKMTPEEFKAYHDLGVEATQDAVDNLERRSMRDMQWASNAKGKVLKQLQKDVAAKRASVRREVTEEVMNEPINRAREFLKRGTLEIDESANQDMRRLATELGMEGSTKLNLGALKEMYGEEGNAIWRALPTGQYGFVSNDGIHPDAVAEMFGFSSGDELVRELLAAENPRDKIAGLTDQRMLERYGDITDPSELKKAADAAIHNDVRTRFVATELNALQKATGGRKILAKAAKEYAEAMVARLKVRDLSPARFASAEARAAKAAETALKAGKLPEAAIEKRNQLINTYATQAAYKAQDEVEKGLRYLKKFDKESVAKSIDPDYVDQIHALMERFDLRKSTTLKDIAKRKALTEWVAKQQELGLEPEIPAEILNEANRKSYKEMPVEEMRGLLDTVKQIEHLGRLKNKLLTAQDQRAFDAIIQEMVVGINEAAGSKPRVDNTTPNTNAGQVVLGFKSYLAAHRKMASLAREMDGWKDGGPVWNTLIRSMNMAGDMEATMRAKASRELAKLVQPVLEGKMGGKGVFFPTLNRSLNREARIAIALNMGNAGNIQRLLDGEGWTAEQLKPVLDTITPAEAEFVQNVWDFFESFRPQIAAKERRVYGKEPAWVEPQPVMLGGKELRGGYYPIKFDPRRSQAAEQHNDAEKAQQMMRGAYTSATTRRSFTKTRVDEVKGRPLLYSMDGIFQGVNEVIHDLSWHEWLIDVNRLFRNKSFDGAIRNRFGADVVKQFKGGIEAVASGETRDTHVLDKPVNYLRMGTSISGLGFNLVNSLVNLSGITQSAVRVGAPWIAQGAGALARNPIALITQIHELSPFMRARTRTFNREVNEVLSVVRGQSKARQHMTRFFYAPMMVTQLAVDMPTWWGAYQKALSQGNEDAKAVAMADQAVIDSQSAGQIKDLAAIQRGSPIWKLFTTFYGYFSSTYNLTAEAVKKTDFNDPLDVLRLGGDFVLLYVVPVLFSVAIKAALMGGDDDEDKLYEKMAAEGIGYMMGTMVGLREFSGAVQTAAGVNQYGGDYGGPAGLRLFNAVAKLAKQAEQGEMDRPLLRQAINVGGILLHLPSGQINRTIDGMTALSEGRTQNPLAIVGGAPTK